MSEKQEQQIVIPTHTYSQLGQDHAVLKHFQKQKPSLHKRYFVEIGAHDGVTLSNTKLLEECGWSGVCIEADPELFQKCEKARTCTVIQAMVYSENHKKLDFSRGDLYGGITDLIDRYHHIKQSEQIALATRTLTDILDDTRSPHHIDYLSIDTEGSELEILKGIDFSKYSFGIIHLEHNFQEERRLLMRRLLESKGYRWTGANQWDDCFELIQFTLVSTYYKVPANTQRQLEIDQCLAKNARHPLLKSIVLINDQKYDLESIVGNESGSNKISQVIVPDLKILSYDIAVKYINENLVGELVIFSNSDIYFDDTLGKLAFYFGDDRIASSFVTLLRYELDSIGNRHIFVHPDGERIGKPRDDSQDCWIWQSPLRKVAIEDLHFELGTYGCDNKFAALVSNAGYNIFNPALDVVTTHMHRSDFRKPMVSIIGTFHPHFIEPTSISF